MKVEIVSAGTTLPVWVVDDGSPATAYSIDYLLSLVNAYENRIAHHEDQVRYHSYQARRTQPRHAELLAELQRRQEVER